MGTQNSQNNLEKKDVGGFTSPNFKTWYKATIIKTVKSWRKVVI